MGKYIYLDHAATTPVHRDVKRVMLSCYDELFGNPSSLHRIGQKASRAVFNARKNIARQCGVQYDEIIFTASATEANNLVLQGAVRAYGKNKKVRVIVSAIEHDSVLRALNGFKNIDLAILPVSKDGLIDLNDLKGALNANTAIVSIGYVNGEVGVIQDIAAIGNIVAEFRGKEIFPIFHTDAVQALQYMDCNMEKLTIDAMTISAHKIYGPKGIGALVFKKDKNMAMKERLKPMIYGGDQEFNMRAGTENVAAIAGFAKAMDMLQKNRLREGRRMKKLQTLFLKELGRRTASFILNGPEVGFLRIPNNVNVYIPSMNEPVQNFLVRLDHRGIAASSGSACASRSSEASHVLIALYKDKERAQKSIRFSMGIGTTEQDIRRTVKILKELI